MSELGAFFWYAIPQESISLERARRVWRTHKLDVRHLPESRRPEHVAAEACSTVHRSPTGPSFTQTENTSEKLTYRVSRASRESDVELVFDKASGTFTCLDLEVLRRVRAVYERNGTRLPATKQRQALRDFLLEAGAENLHGSIYFMGAQQRRQRDGKNYISGLEELAWAGRVVVDLYGAEAEFHCVFVEHDKLQDAYVGASVDRVLTGEIVDLTAEVRSMLENDRTRKWRSDKIETIRARKRRLEQRLDSVCSLLPGEYWPMTARGACVPMDEAVSELVMLTEAPIIV